MIIAWQALQLAAQKAVASNEYQLAVENYEQLLTETATIKGGDEIQEVRLRALAEQGHIYRLLGLPDQVKASYEQYYVEAGSSHHAVEALNLLGNYYDYVGQSRKGLEMHQEALYLAKSLNYTEGRATSLSGIGRVRQHMGQWEEALTVTTKALALFEQLEDIAGQITSRAGLGGIYFSSGQIDRAMGMQQSVLELAHLANSQSDVVDALNNLGKCHQLLFSMDQALICHQEGLIAAQALGMEQVQADLKRNIGVDKLYLGDIEVGLTYLQEGLALADEMQDWDIILASLYSLALGEIVHGDPEMGRSYVERLQKLAEESDRTGEAANGMHALGVYYRHTDRKKEAEEAWQQAIFMAHQAGKQRLLWQLHVDLADLSDNDSLAMVHRRIAAEVVDQIAYPMTDPLLKKRFLDAPPVRRLLEQIK